MERICVFCGVSTGRAAAYATAARAFGQAVAVRGLGLVFGGGRVGLMGAVADGALAGGSEVIGVIPRSLVDRELAHGGLSALEVVGSLHERKARMAELADAFVALPGGFGTLDELLELLTWSQLGLHGKPVGLLDVDGCWRRRGSRAMRRGGLRARVGPRCDCGLFRSRWCCSIASSGIDGRGADRVHGGTDSGRRRW